MSPSVAYSVGASTNVVTSGAATRGRRRSGRGPCPDRRRLVARGLDLAPHPPGGCHARHRLVPSLAPFLPRLDGRRLPCGRMALPTARARGRHHQARARVSADRGRRTELLRRRRHAAGEGGAGVVPVINKLAASFENIVVTQDWHTPGHASFASTHAGKKPFETTSMPYGTQVLWPDHCVQGSDDAALHKDLKLPTAALVIRKGFHKDVDSYSAFVEADGKTTTGLAGYLKERGITTVFVTGLATDFCVAWTALDARKLGFTTYVIEDATRAIDLNGSLAAAWKQMEAAGVKRIQASDIA